MKSFLKGMTMMSVALIMASASSAAETINFGIISTESQQNLKTKWEPLLDDMKQKTGLEVKAFFASDYAGIVEGMRFNKVQIAWYGNKSAIEAVDRANGEVFAQTVYANGQPGYWSVLIVPKDSPIQNIDQTLKCDKSLNFGNGDVNSTSGYLVPMTFVFAKNGIDPKKCFKNVTNSNHETNAMAVANKQVDVATNNTESMERIERNNPKAFVNIREIWRSPLIPVDPIVWRKDLPEVTKAKLRNFFFTYGTDKTKGDKAKEKKILADLTWAAFRTSDDNQLLPLRVMEVTKSIAEAEADTKLDRTQRAAKIQELTEKKARYEAELAKVKN